MISSAGVAATGCLGAAGSGGGGTATTAITVEATLTRISASGIWFIVESPPDVVHGLLHDPLGPTHLPHQRLYQVASMDTTFLSVLSVYLQLPPHLLEVVPEEDVHLDILRLPGAGGVHRTHEVAVGCIYLEWDPKSIVISFV